MRGAWVLALALCASPAWGQAHTQWRFDFGDGAAARGYERVASDMAFTPDRGFGFEPGAAVRSETRGRDPLRGDVIVNDGPFQFSVTVPEGDYRVTVTFADARAAIVRGEQRRLMLEQTPSRALQRDFVVNVRNARLEAPPQNAPGGSAVRISPGEAGSLNWDDKLTLEFDRAAIAGVTIERVEVPRVFLLGDSTVTDQAAEPYASWGQMLTRFFGTGAAIANHAHSGETLKSTLAELRLDKALSQMRQGDWALIQFGHNDQKQQWPQTYAAAETTFRAYLRTYIAEIRRRGATPVLVTSVNRRTFNAQGRIENSLGGYPDAMRAVAAEENIALIDLNTITAGFYEALGPQRAPLAFAQEGRDATHHNNYGAYEIARAVATSLRTQNLPLARHLRDDWPAFDPAHPTPPEQFVLAASLRREAAAPRGN